MTKAERQVRLILEILHPVMLLALTGPALYTFFEKRADTQVIPLALAGLSLLPLSAVIRTALRRVKTLPVFLLITGTAFLLTCLAGRAAAGTVFAAGQDSAGAFPSALLMLELLFGGLFLLSSGIRIRIRENRRERARIENDTAWMEKPVFAEKPQAFVLVWFAAVYLAGLVTACPPLCSVSLAEGLLYLAAVILYRAMEVTGDYLRETASLSNVPAGKIRRTRSGITALLLMLLVPVAAAAFVTAGARRYTDLRKWRPGAAVYEAPEEEELPPQEKDPITEIIGEQMELPEPPAWLIAMSRVLSAAAITLFWCGAAYFLWKTVAGTVKAFDGIPEENGDIALRLEEDTVSEGVTRRVRTLFRREPLTEAERIRRNYRRVIRRYRKTRPEKSETPAEIEQGTAFPEGFDTEALHISYEKARYGPSS